MFWEPSWELFSVNKQELHLVISTLAKMIDQIFQEMSPSVNPKSNAFSEGRPNPHSANRRFGRSGSYVKFCLRRVFQEQRILGNYLTYLLPFATDFVCSILHFRSLYDQACQTQNAEFGKILNPYIQLRR